MYPSFLFYLAFCRHIYPLPPLLASLPSPFLFLSHTPSPTHTFHHLLPTYPTTSIMPLFLLYIPPPPPPLPPPYMSLPPPLPHNNTPYVSLTNPASCPTCGGCCSLQGNGFTALMLASWQGHTEIFLALLAAPGIKVNHADKVSIFPLTPSHVVVWGEGVGGLPHLPPLPDPLSNVLSPSNIENVPHH